MSVESAETNDQEVIRQRRDDALKRALKMPPAPHRLNVKDGEKEVSSKPRRAKGRDRKA